MRFRVILEKFREQCELLPSDGRIERDNRVRCFGALVMNDSASPARAQHRTMSKFLKLAHKFNSFYLNGTCANHYCLRVVLFRVFARPPTDYDLGSSLGVPYILLCLLITIFLYRFFRATEERMSRFHRGRRTSRSGTSHRHNGIEPLSKRVYCQTQ